MGKKETKRLLRKKVRARLTVYSEKKIKALSKKIAARVWGHPLYRRAGALFCFVSRPGEVDTHPILRRALKDKKKVFVPKYAARRDKIYAKRIRRFPRGLKPGKYGILEPFGKGERLLSLKKVDLFLLPGMAFDKQGTRLGRGKGTFDRFLEQEHYSPARSIGLALERQIFPRLPRERHDIAVGLLITEKRTIQVKR